jgi:hypothetical protein
MKYPPTLKNLVRGKIIIVWVHSKEVSEALQLHSVTASELSNQFYINIHK